MIKPLDELRISFYRNKFDKKPVETTLLTVLENCLRTTYSTSINTIRRYHAEGDEEAAQKLKNALPCFTPSGLFNGMHSINNLLLHSNIICLDFDHVEDLQRRLTLCKEDWHTAAALESPTDGLKIFVYVENAEGRHREAQQLASAYYDKLLDLTSDPACKDESRLCFVTYSPNGYIATLYDPFVLPEIEPGVPTEETAAGEEEFNGIEAPYWEETFNEEEVPDEVEAPVEEKAATEEDDTEKRKDAKQFVMSYVFLFPLSKGQRHTNLFKLSCEACKRGYAEKDILREIGPLLEKTNFPEDELTKTLSSGYKYIKQHPTPKAAPTATPAENAKMSKCHYDTLINGQDDDENFWEGEELRKETPCFDEKVFRNLPNLLEDCFIGELNERERDITLLSCLTALSAVLPQTSGMYNHKKYSPHLFTVVIAPAASGKSIGQTGRYLINSISEHIYQQSEISLKKYENELQCWKAAQGNKSKQKQKEEEPEKMPEMPPFRALIIPASISYTRMQLQMQANARIGSIIIDTEAQTLSTANGMDCGNFDDMLRKAFEHETIDSAYKANGIAHLRIPNPQLALWLTGTPGQVQPLFINADNGLSSRVFFYTFRMRNVWKTMGEDSFSYEEYFQSLAPRMEELYVFCEKNPVSFSFSRLQWNKLNSTFSNLLDKVAARENDSLQAVVKRYAFLVMRLSMIISRLRQFECGNTESKLLCTEEDFDRALYIALCCYRHTRLILTSIPTQSINPLKNPDKTELFIKDLPDNFTTEEAHVIGANHGFSKRKVARLLASLNGVDINKLSHGLYTKAH